MDGPVNLRTDEAADLEAIEAALFYESRREGLGEQFTEELQKAFDAIDAHPERYAQLETTELPIRRVLLRRFPYYVAYEILDDEVVIWAVANAAREPNYWQSRRW